MTMQPNLFCMRRFWALWFLLILGSMISAGPADVEDHLARFRSMGNREDGSPGERAAFDFIAEQLDGLGVAYERTPLEGTEGGHTYSENLIAVVPGTHPGRYIIAAPVDGGAFAASFLLELAAGTRVSPPKHTLELTFLGAERGDTPYHPYGSRHAAAAAEDAPETVVLYLEGDEVPQVWHLRVGGQGIVSPLWFVQTVTRTLSAQFIPFRLRGADIQLARLGLQGEIRVLTPWLETGLPVIKMEGRGTAVGSDRFRQIDRLMDALTTIDQQIDDVPHLSPSAFVFYRPLSTMRPRVIPERPYVVGFLAVSALLLMVVLFRHRDVSLNLRRFAPHLWAWPLLVILTFLFFFLATLFVEETLLLADFPGLWRYAPGVFVFLKLSVAASLSLIFILITRGLPLPRSPHFYSYAAIATAGIASLVVMAIDITIAAYSIWTIVTLLLFIATRNERWKAFLLATSVVPYLMSVVVVIQEPYEALIESLLLSRIAGNIILTLLLVPVILGITSLNYWRMHYHRVRRAVLTPLATLILSISALITLAWILNMEPFGPNRPQPVELIDRINLISGERRLEVQSPAPIGHATLTLGDRSYPLENLGRQAEVRTRMDRTPLAVDHQSRSFLGRRIITITISGDRSPKELDLFLHSNEPFTLHDSDTPFEVAPGGAEARLFIGRNPPFPLSLRFTVNSDAELTLICTGRWENPTEPPRIIRDNLTEHTTRIAHLETRL